MTTVVSGTYPDLQAAELAVRELVAEGFAREGISVVFAGTPDHAKRVRAITEDTPRGALVGAIAGSAMASLAFGALAVSGFGLAVAGPLLTMLTAGGAGAAAGGFIGTLVGLGVSAQAAEEYETAIESGAALVAVHVAHARAGQVRGVLARTGAQMLSDSVHPAWAERREEESA